MTAFVTDRRKVIKLQAPALDVRGNVLRRRQGWPDLEAPKEYNPQRITLNQAYSLVVFLLVVEGETGSKKIFFLKGRVEIGQKRMVNQTLKARGQRRSLTGGAATQDTDVQG